MFPFNRLKLTVVAVSSEARARLEAVFEGQPALQDRIVERLRAAGCDVGGLSIKLAYVSHADSQWKSPDFHIEFARIARTAPVAPPVDAPPAARIELKIVNGSAGEAVYAFASRASTRPLRGGAR